MTPVDAVVIKRVICVLWSLVHLLVIFMIPALGPPCHFIVSSKVDEFIPGMILICCVKRGDIFWTIAANNICKP